MRSTIRAIPIAGYYWHAAEVNGIIYILRRIGRVGDCLLF